MLKHQLTNEYLEYSQLWFPPLLNTLNKLKQTHSNQTIFVGVNGCQGSGKSTLADYLVTRLKADFQLDAVAISLDDFYLTKSQRLHLAETIHPLLGTRGVPGTHDTKLLAKTIKDLVERKINVPLPRFNKALDEPFANVNWPIITSTIGIVILEGWCWGTPAQSKDQLLKPINSLESRFDKNCQWRNYVNKQLIQHYQPLYSKMNFWIMLKAPTFDCVYQWRLEQENKLKDANSYMLSQNSMMNEKEIAHFIQHFQRLTEHALSVVPNKMNVIFELDTSRKIKNAIYD